MYEQLIRFVIRRPIVTILTVGLVTALFAVQIPTIRVETDLDGFIPADDDAVINQDYMESVFGRQSLLLIVIRNTTDPDGIYNPHTLGRLAEIGGWLSTRNEFETALTSDLRSLATANDILADEDGLTVKPFMEFPPKTREDALAVKTALENNAIFYGTLASEDGLAALILVRESVQGKSDRPSTYFGVKDYLDQLQASGGDEKYFMGGLPVVQGVFEKYIPAEAVRMLPLVLILIGIFLFVAFRSVRGVLIPMAILFSTELWMLGFHAACDRPFYTISSILPVIIVAIAVADSIHLLARYYDAQLEFPAHGREYIVAYTMREMGGPILMTSITTAVGFLSMYTTRIPPLQDFGITISFGIMAALILTVVLIPAFLMLMPLRSKEYEADPTGVGSGPIHDFLTASTRWVLRAPRLTIFAFVALVVVTGAGIPFLSTNSALVKQFKSGHFLRDADAVVNRHFPGSSILDLVVWGEADGTIKEPEILRRIDRFQTEIETIPGVGDSFSIAEMIKRMNRMMHGDDPAFETIPDSKELVAQYLLLYSISADPGDFDDVVDYGYRHARVMVYLNNPGTHLAREVEGRARELSTKIFSALGPVPVQTILAGSAYQFGHTEHHVVRGQAGTLIVCLPIMLLLNWLMFRSRVMALMSILPVTISVIVIYGSMAYVGLTLEIANVMLGGMAIGIGVDFAIHYLFKYRLFRNRGLDHEEAVIATSTTAGRALLFNAIVLFAGFLVMLTARFNPQIKLGSLVAATVLICYVSTIYLFPVLLRSVPAKRFSV